MSKSTLEVIMKIIVHCVGIATIAYMVKNKRIKTEMGYLCSVTVRTALLIKKSCRKR